MQSTSDAPPNEDAFGAKATSKTESIWARQRFRFAQQVLQTFSPRVSGIYFLARVAQLVEASDLGSGQ